MKDIFTDLYKKVVGFFQTQEKEDNAKDVAVNRMKLVLMQDRTNLNPFLLEKMRGEMIAVLAKYVEMDQEALELSFEQEGEQMALMLSIPVIRAKEEEEIQAILKAEEEAKAVAEAEESETEEDDETCFCGCQEGGACSCESCSVDTEEEEDVEEIIEEEVCTFNSKEDEVISESPDEIEELEEDTPTKKSKRK